MSEIVKTATTKRRHGYLIPIEGSELEGEIIRGCKYVPIHYRGNHKDKALTYFKKVRIWPCVYCGQEARLIAYFHFSGYDKIERLCQVCADVHGPIHEADS